MWVAGQVRRRSAGGRPNALRPGFALSRGMKVGLYGGSFNPAHEGHAHVAETARQRLGLDRVIWLVAPQNPLKSSSETQPLAERLAGVDGKKGSKKHDADADKHGKKQGKKESR